MNRGPRSRCLDRPANEVFPAVTTSSLPTVDFLKERINKEAFELVGYGVSWTAEHGEFYFKNLTFDGYRRYAIADANGHSLLDPSVLQVKANPNGADTTDGMLGGGDSGGAVLAEGTLVAVMGGNNFGGVTLAARLDTVRARAFLSQF
jgi:hypothetical protein